MFTAMLVKLSSIKQCDPSRYLDKVKRLYRLHFKDTIKHFHITVVKIDVSKYDQLLVSHREIQNHFNTYHGIVGMAYILSCIAQIHCQMLSEALEPSQSRHSGDIMHKLVRAYIIYLMMWIRNKHHGLMIMHSSASLNILNVFMSYF